MQRSRYFAFRMLLIAGLSLAVHTIFAQEEAAFVESRPTILGLTVDYGFLIKHSESLREIDNAYPFGIGLDWSKQLITRSAWEFCNCFPRMGVNLTYWNYDNPKVLGSGLIATGYVEPYFQTHKRSNLFVRMGLGGAYLDNPYDEVSNPQNLSYSTNLSFSITVGVGLNYRINNKLSLRMAAMYNHISNGGIRTPNKGLNYPTLQLGVNQSLEDITYPTLLKKGKPEPPVDRTRITLTHFSGWSNASVGDKSKYYVSGLLVNYSHWIASRSALTAGTEWIADFSRKELIRLQGDNESFLTGALLLGHEFWLGRVTFSQALGIYYFNQYRTTDDVYQRYGLTYNFTRRFFAGVNLKAHRHVADFFDFRIGYTF